METNFKKGDRIALKDEYVERHPRFANKVLVICDVENDVHDVFEGMPASPITYQFTWYVLVEGEEESRHIGRTSLDMFDRLPEWSEVLGPLAGDWPPMTLRQFRSLDEDLQLLKGLAKTIFQPALSRLACAG